ncbi:hypothetical protein ACN47E_003999 [Coniothyrium glycines]
MDFVKAVQTRHTRDDYGFPYYCKRGLACRTDPACVLLRWTKNIQDGLDSAKSSRITIGIRIQDNDITIITRHHLTVQLERRIRTCQDHMQGDSSDTCAGRKLLSFEAELQTSVVR